MKNRKMNIDRPQIDSKEIQAGMNFGQLMVGYQAMSKPFYKSNWFFGTTGLASIGLIVGGTFAFQSPDEQEHVNTDLLSDSPPPEITVPQNTLLAVSSGTSVAPEELMPETIQITKENQVTDDKKPTPLIEDESEKIEVDEQVLTLNVTETAVDHSDTKTGNETLDLTPRINGIMNGDITREDLFNNKGITTGSDVSIIHFELHLIDGLGGKVFEEESNQLNDDMKNALLNTGKGETIYFENIKGRTSDGRVVRLNPLRYVLLN
jgi:hypothetical protein